ncbi:MAG: DUF72 domain-containing protein [Dongiaceae bacterium]
MTGTIRVAARAAARREGRDVYIYFDNDAKVRAPVDAQALMRRVAAPARRRNQAA